MPTSTLATRRLSSSGHAESAACGQSHTDEDDPPEVGLDTDDDDEPQTISGVRVGEFDRHPATDAELAAIAAFAHLSESNHHGPDGTGIGGVPPPPPMFPMVLHAAFVPVAPSHRAAMVNAPCDERDGSTETLDKKQVRGVMRLATCNIHRLRDPAIDAMIHIASRGRAHARLIVKAGAPLLCARYLSMRPADVNRRLHCYVLQLVRQIAVSYREGLGSCPVPMLNCRTVKYHLAAQLVGHVRRR